MNIKRSLFTFSFFMGLLNAQGLDALLEEYEVNADSSNKTANEKVGHVRIFTEQELRQMQYKDLGDLLNTLECFTASYNTYGTMNLSYASRGGSVSTSIRLYINDHEVSSVHTLSPFLTWDRLPIEFISHIELYNGDSSFRLGSEPGIAFIKVYTKSAKKQNGGMFQTSVNNINEKDISLSHSTILDNGWSYFAFGSYDTKDEKQQYKSEDIFNDYKRKYAYLDINNDKTFFNLGFADLKKDNFKGLSVDSVPDSGEIESSDIFVTLKNHFLDDSSLSALLSVDINDRKYSEENSAGLMVLPVINFTNPLSIPKSYSEDLTFTKYTASLTKEHTYKSHNFVATLSAKKKKYDINSRDITTLGNSVITDQPFSDFSKESLYSFAFEDVYEVNSKFNAMFNLKVDSYNRDSIYLDDADELMYRIGGIYTPSSELGFKAFYSSISLPPSFYHVDFMDKSKSKLDSQQIDTFSIETMYTKDNNRFRLLFGTFDIKDLIVLNTTGFSNMKDKRRGENLEVTYDYKFNLNNNLHLSLYHTDIDFTIQNSKSGGLLKYYGKKGNIEYFTSLIYKKGYTYNGFDVKSGYDLNTGATYYINENLSVSISGKNILDKALKSLQQDYSTTPSTSFVLENRQREIGASLRWMF